jgi:transcriptional regulator with XRE-family HTH domain
MSNRPPVFDALAFADWLTRHMDAWEVGVAELADRIGVHRSSITALRNGKAGYSTRDPSVNLIVAVAWGLRMPLDFVLAQAGLTWDGPTDRWDLLLTERERTALARKLGGDAAQLDALLRAAVDTETTRETV